VVADQMKNLAAIPQALLVRISAPINHTAVLVVQWGIVLRRPHCTLHARLSERLTSASFTIIITFTATDTCPLHRPKTVWVLTVKGTLLETSHVALQPNYLLHFCDAMQVGISGHREHVLVSSGSDLHTGTGS